MFFKMLKSDLKCKKGLNVILFIFIMVASVLVFAGSVQIYSNLTLDSRKAKVCNTSQADMMIYDSLIKTDEKRQRLFEILDEEKNVTGYTKYDAVRIDSLRMDYPRVEEENNNFLNWSTFIMKLPHESDLLYDTNDQPFTLKSGTAAFPVDFSHNLGLRIGDKVEFTTVMGDVYELEVACFFKECAFDSKKRIIVADEDYDILTKDEVNKVTICGLFMKDGSYEKCDGLYEKFRKEDMIVPIYARSRFTDDSFIIQNIISAFVVIISVFLIIIIFMTIRFTMIADLKNEEKEIGMMKALGVDSFSFRWLFAAKYIAFAIIGGAIGIAAGVPISGMAVNLFDENAILPQRYETIIIGIAAVLSIIVMMIGFSLLVMRRINKISVIDSIHGENHGERFGKGSPIFLHKRKKISVPFFLAVSDILRRFKRYIFLIIAYTLGTAIILLSFNVRNSIISKEFIKLYMMHTIDFDIHTRGEFKKEVEKRSEAEGKNYSCIINEMFEEKGIPAYIDSLNYSFGVLLNEKGENRKNISVLWGDGQIEKLNYRKGGKIPTLENEAAMSYFTATQMGVKLGDVINVRITEESEDGTSEEEVERQFVITAFIDVFEGEESRLVLSKEYRKGQSLYSGEWIGCIINAPEKEKAGIVKQMKEYFGDDVILTTEETVMYNMEEYDRLFALLEYVMGGALLFVLILITYLYSTVFVTEETAEIALLKSTGFTDGAIRKWHILRLALITVFSIVLAEVMLKTLGQLFMTAFMANYNATGVRMLPEIPVTFIVIPLIVITAVMVTVLFTLRGINRIGIWKITEE